MNNTDKIVCRQLAALLAAHRVKHVFVSPGSRNAPLIVAISRHPELSTTVVVDERVAAFMALGYALISNEPVAIVCTSGTALLDYSPAIAEAYYRKLPLIVVSADRPAEWIDQDDSQTLRQSRALANYVKLSCDIPEITTPNLEWYANRLINDALIAAQTGRKSPVHINIQLDAPLNGISDLPAIKPRTIRVTEPIPNISLEDARTLADEIIKSERVMVIAGFLPPDPMLDVALDKFAQLPNVTVFTETISNLHSPHYISRIDTTLSAMTPQQKEEMRPDIVITLGGALVSRFVKDYLRKNRPRQHWHVGISHTTIDCLQALTLRVETEPSAFFLQLQQSLIPNKKSIHGVYHNQWQDIFARACASHDAYINSVGWSDLRAFATFMPRIPKDWNLQLSNGTPVRYSQLIGDLNLHRSDCNRGVSGIDGCTSTAIGSSMAYDDVTLLITGDMSAQYDVGALAYATGKARFKVIVMCNGGGGIFRFIPATADLDELDEYLAFSPNLPLKSLCEGYNIEYLEAHDEKQLQQVWQEFIKNDNRPSLLAIYTPPRESATILREYFNRK